MSWHALIGATIEDIQPTDGGAYAHLSTDGRQWQGYLPEGALDELEDTQAREEVPANV